MDKTEYKRRKERGDHRAFLWLSRERHIVPIKAELEEHFNATGIHMPLQVKLRQIVDDYCQRKRKPSKAVKRRPALAA